ncbi:SdiA-regulated domain-containing protein [Dokdonia genika]|uniref:SdiA-regulated domain-containing protein n=1 Tax=Dokdonia genika TaxID=308113 RepID=A0ABV9L9S3_9FLAO
MSVKTIKYIVIIICSLVTLGAILAFSIEHTFTPSDKKDKKYDCEITQKWRLPKILGEVSGIAWLSENEIACVQDEDGIIFIYHLKADKIIEQIPFAGSGDYEGIAIYNNDAYVMRSDGVIYEILRFRESDKKISKLQTPFSAKNNMETLVLDAKNQHLITAPKDRDLEDDSFKGLYHIPLDTKKMNRQPTIRINMNDVAFKSYLKKKVYRTFSPSDVAIHPKTGQYYVLEGINPKLVILDKNGTILKVYELDKKSFAQPEGITFSPDGTLYISTEGKGGDAAIFKVVLDK